MSADYLEVELRIGKKYALYIPVRVARALGLREGDRVILRAARGRIEIRPLRDPVDLALHGGKFASVEAEEVEAVSLEEQGRAIKSPT
ncbi:MAG: AbrB/MazE/SpoVT family DNA-binding domain-containing protein [Thermoprotei archaeon]|nr:MAG: AbrB/MazE/SpoVT family DNA-binding domain-containing protein [Thermoprotei archaeon]